MKCTPEVFDVVPVKFQVSVNPFPPWAVVVVAQSQLFCWPTPQVFGFCALRNVHEPTEAVPVPVEVALPPKFTPTSYT